MTPSEIFKLYDGYKWREEQALERIAWQTAHLLNIQLGQGQKPYTVDILLGREKMELDEHEDEVTKEEEFEKLMELLDQKRSATL